MALDAGMRAPAWHAARGRLARLARLGAGWGAVGCRLGGNASQT